MEALLRRDTAAAADLTPVSWSVADSLTEQIYAVADETIKSEHRVKDDPTPFGIWSALVTRIIATSSEEFRSAGCQAALQKELSTLRSVKSGTKNGVRMARSCAAGHCLCGSRVRDHGRETRRGAEGPQLAHLQGPLIFASNNVQTSNGQTAWELYREVSQTVSASLPAAMQTARAALAVAALNRFTPKVRDVTQAYL